MKFPLPQIAAATLIAFAAPLSANVLETTQTAPEASEEADPIPAPTPAEESAEQPAPSSDAGVIEIPAITAPDADEDANAEAADDARVICRSIRVDMSSRRKTRVCRTEAEWRALNQRR